MKSKNKNQTPSFYDLWVVSQAAGNLTSQACTISARHLQDGVTRSIFNREVAYYARSIVNDVEQGKKTVAEGLIEIKKEQRSLLDQSIAIGRNGIGAVAGALQIATGAGICYASVGTLCLIAGVPLMAHGANNLYEGGRNLVTGRSDTVGPVRTVYQAAASAFGHGEREANMAYGAVDIGLSIYSTVRHIYKPDAWRLFRYLDSDRIRAYKTMTPTSLAAEAATDAITLRQLHEESKK
ncbi:MULTISPECIES: DUF4225 domain-containing protein [Pseudomonas]|uniref:DUF4225 domain-containing protein n=2 Tax=Pseudomonas TaxID=286 RepID=A0A0D0SVZ7_PSEFL|nr:MULTISPECIES: DUF4225 domain-containing protein [Pseudomonas fluorescens group]AZE61884.1 hypothetical protein C4K02_3525 [Pseudomonas synxantha]KIR16196.1 hypothetical protein PFLU3_53790 [Pseudomonas fluorescens]